jgi:NADPH-dependent glutamate synthase beta subunit-like oxidoreductase/NAD-dependent dihydropyrimidine dehydrogenase PreA subunit
LRIYEYEKGSFPDVRVHLQFIPCYHCEKPACVDICPTKAIYKEEKYGAVLIDEEKCNGCRLCYYACPYGAIVFERDKADEIFGENLVHVPCSQACPAHINIPRYVRCIGEGKYAEAVAVIREKIPFPSVCGRVCYHPCETKCERAKIDSPVSIRVLKRYATDHDTGLWRANSKVARSTGKKVAVVGSGPAGLTAAFYLAKLGHAVAVFEALPEAGGMMRVGIPDYRLPKNVLRAEVNEIKEVGVSIKTNTRIESLDKLFTEGFNAIFLAVGAHEGIKLGIEGEDSPGVVGCATFLREVALGQKVQLGNKVAVVGGGNTAIDAARVALRVGAKEVSILYRRTLAEMPASREDITAALEEGIKIQYLVAPAKIFIKDDKLQLVCLRIKLGEPDVSGRRRPESVKGSEFTNIYDNIITAVGQRPYVPEEFKVAVDRSNVIKADHETLATSRKGVYAGGDAQTGPDSVIAAIAAGRQAAISIDKYLGGYGIIDEALALSVIMEPPSTPTEKTQHIVHAPRLEPEERIKSFAEAELPLDKQTAADEAQRCLQCDPTKAQKCTMCFDRLESGLLPMCVLSCPDRALDFGPLKNLNAKYSNQRDLEDLPDSHTTNPAVVFKPHAPKRKLVVYDAKKALELMMKRGNLPPVYTSLDDISDIPEGTAGRDRLVIKHDSAADLMRHTRSDEG